MTLWMPKKKPLYAPMLGTLGGGSVRGFGRGAMSTSTAMEFVIETFGPNLTLNASSSVIDLREYSAGTGTIDIQARGGAGGNSSGASGYTGWALNGTVPESAIAGKIICFVGAGNGNSATRGTRDAGAGGGFSGIIQLDPTDYSNLKTLTHIFSAGGGGGAGTNSNGVGNSALRTGNASMSFGAASTHKNASGSVGSFPNFNWAQRPGNFYGGGDLASNQDGTDNFQGGGGGGCGPLPGGNPDDPNGPGILGGNSSAPPHGESGNVFGGYGGGGSGSHGGDGGNAWRVTSSGGGGGGFQAGAGGGYISDGTSSGGTGGCAYSFDPNWVSFQNVQGSSYGELVLTFST